MNSSWLLLLLLHCFFHRSSCESLIHCSNPAHRCLEFKSCSVVPKLPLTVCGYQPLTVCCQPPKSARIIEEPPLVTLNPNPGKCGLMFGKPTLGGLIVGGDTVEQGKWPWMVAIMTLNKKKVPVPVCTGFLIDKRHVLTAAHCFPKRSPYLYSVRLGHVKLSRSKIIGISRIRMHEDYRPNSYHDDVALVTLSRDVKQVQPVCLPAAKTTHAITGKGATVVGWGSTRTGGPMSEMLQELIGLPLMSPSDCESALRDKMAVFNSVLPRGIEQSMLCAGITGVKKDTCTGDSGGPLMVQSQDRWYAIGIVAFGTNKCAIGAPGVYTKVSHYVDWIERNKE